MNYLTSKYNTIFDTRNKCQKMMHLCIFDYHVKRVKLPQGLAKNTFYRTSRHLDETVTEKEIHDGQSLWRKFSAIKKFSAMRSRRSRRSWRSRRKIQNLFNNGMRLSMNKTTKLQKKRKRKF